MSKPVIFVLGASGKVGAATVTALSERFADKANIKAGVRDKSSERAANLQGLHGVTLVTADMGQDKSKLVEAFRGVQSVFIVTPGTKERVEFTVAAAQAAKEAGVKFLLVVSVLTADLTDTIFGSQFKKIETEVSKIGLSHCFLRLPLFVDNYWTFKDDIKCESTILHPVDPEKPYTPVVVADVGKAAAVILTQPEKHANKTYKLVSDRHTFTNVTAAFCEALGKEVRYKRVSYDDAKQKMVKCGFQGWMADGVLELYKLIDQGSHVTNESDLSQYQHLTGEKPTDLKTWVHGVASAFKC